jgi:hypothetical protein
MELVSCHPSGAFNFEMAANYFGQKYTTTRNSLNSSIADDLPSTYLGSFFLGPEDVKSISLGAIWILQKRLP